MTKTALITGASSGIGKELAQIHAEHRGNLVVVARSVDKLKSLKAKLEKEFGIQVKIIVKNLAFQEAPGEIYKEIKEAGIKIDYLINNAGFGGLGKFHERQLEDDLNMIKVNISALTALTRYFLPDFVHRNTGKILNVSSTAGYAPGPLQAVYYATKAYVTSFSNAISEELSDTAVTVTTLIPGATETDFGKVSGMEKTRLFSRTASPRTVAEIGYAAMLRGKLNVLAGVSWIMRIRIAMIPFTPRRLLLKMVRNLQEVRKSD